MNDLCVKDWKSGGGGGAVDGGGGEPHTDDSRSKTKRMGEREHGGLARHTDGG